MIFFVKEFRWAPIFFLSMAVVSCGGEKSEGGSSAQEIAIETIANYAESAGLAPSLQDYFKAGINGVNADNLEKMNNKISELTYEDVDSREEIQVILDELGSDILDTLAPVITLIGANPITLIEGSQYIELGASAIDDKDDHVEVNISGSVDVETVGVYTVTYTATDKAGNASSLERIVKVVSGATPDTTKPVILLNGNAAISLTKGDTYTEAGATAIDDRDGVVSVEISGEVNTNKVGIYTLKYTAEDKAKNKATATRVIDVQEMACAQVITHAYNPETNEEQDFATPCDVPEGWIVGTPPVEDTIPPVITRLGDATVNLIVGDVYEDAGATASDNKDGDISNDIAIHNPVNVNVAASYAVTYNVDDAAGNHAIEVTRAVIVNEPSAKVYGLDGGVAIADPVVESVNGKSVIIMPTDVSSENKVPVVFFAPGFRNSDYTKYQTLLNFIASHGYAVIFANDIDGFSANSILTHLREMVNNPVITPLLDTTRIGVIGHSSGGGHAFKILDELSDDEGWGDNGRFLLALDPWFAFGMTESDMKTLPSNSNVVIQQFGEGGNNVENGTDARIPLTEYYLLDSISNSQKDYQVFVNADHGYPYGSGEYSDMQGILKPLDALMELTFKASPDAGAQQVALGVGNDDPYDDGYGIQEVKLIRDYQYPCHGANTIINYCAIHSGARPPESGFSEIPTNTEIAKPALKGKYIDREFGKEVTRITDRINQNDIPKVDSNGNKRTRGNAHPYPKTQAWNSDMTMFRLNYRLYDAHTLDELPITSGTDSLSELYGINGALTEKKWSSVSPNVFYGVSNGSGANNGNFKKGTINRVTNTIQYDVVKSFASDDYTFDQFTLGKYEGNIDFNDRYVAFAARKEGLKYLTAIVYDIQNDTVVKMKDFPDIAWPDQGQVFDWLTISPLGNYVLFSTGGKIHQYDKNLNFVRQLSDSAGHGDLGIDVSGGEAYVQYEYGANSGIWIYRLSDGFRTRLLPDKYNGGHISCRNYDYQGWCYASTTTPGYKDVVALKLDYTGAENHIVRRFVQTQNSATAQSAGNVSPDGKQVLFESNWGDENVHWTEKDTYLVR